MLPRRQFYLRHGYADHGTPIHLHGGLLAATTSRQASPATGTFHEGLQLVASPAQPTLSELWDGHAAVELLGPAGTEVTMTVKLEDGRVPAWAASVEVVYEKPPRDLFPIKQKSPQSSIPNYC